MSSLSGRSCTCGDPVHGSCSCWIWRHPESSVRWLCFPPSGFLSALDPNECCWVSSGALRSFVVVWWFVLAKRSARIFTACFVHGHVSTQATCLQMPARRFLKILLKGATAPGCAMCWGDQAANHQAWLFLRFCSESLFLAPGSPSCCNPKRACSLLNAVIWEVETLSGNTCYMLNAVMH